MKQMYNFRKKHLMALCFAFFCGTAQATVYTALVSGNFASAATWGGVVPGILLSSDVVIIPTGINVSLTGLQTFSGTSSLSVDGALTAPAGGVLIMTSGILSGTGNIFVDSMVLGLTSGFTFTGGLTARTLTSLGANIATAANVTVNSALNLTSGTFNQAAGNLTMGNNSRITLVGGALGSSGTGLLHLDSTYDVIYATTSATTGVELSGTGLDSITVNMPGTVTMSANAAVNGVVTLMTGSLALNGHNFTFNSGSDLSATGSGMIVGSTTSNIIVNSTAGLTGALRFATGGNMLNDLTVNTGAASSVSLGSNLTLNGALNLQSGKIKLGTNNLKIVAGAMVNGGSANSYVMTNSTGNLILNLVVAGSDTFKVGSVTNYAPVIVKANAASAAGDVSVNVADGVLSGGTAGVSLSATQPLVNATWFVSSSAATVNYDMQTMWSAGMEINGFDRTHAYLSHYIGSSWDLQIPGAAGISGSMYTMSRTGLTSLSPFMVSDANANNTKVPGIAGIQPAIAIYPNPATNILLFSSNVDLENVSIYNMSGKYVGSFDANTQIIDVANMAAGMYVIHFTGRNVDVVQQFIKQ